MAERFCRDGHCPHQEAIKVSIDDAAELASLLKGIGWFAFLGKRPDDEVREHVKGQLARCLADDSHSMYVTESDDGKISGYVSAHWIPFLFMRGPERYISELFVRDGARLSLMNLRHRESYQRQFYIKAGWQECTEAANFVCQLD